MRIEKINANKIKVMIDNQEAKEWNISFKNISENTPEVQQMFWTAIKLAEKNVDFSVNGAKLFVEAVQGSEDDGYGFGMMITRVCNEDELNQAINNCRYKGKIKHARLKCEETVRDTKAIYRFRDFDSVCYAVDEIYDIYEGSSKLYKYKSEFYIYLIPEESVDMKDIDTLISEFGFKVSDGQYVHGRLNEYGELMIAENAVEVMEEYFSIK